MYATIKLRPSSRYFMIPMENGSATLSLLNKVCNSFYYRYRTSTPFVQIHSDERCRNQYTRAACPLFRKPFLKNGYFYTNLDGLRRNIFYSKSCCINMHLYMQAKCFWDIMNTIYSSYVCGESLRRISIAD